MWYEEMKKRINGSMNETTECGEFPEWIARFVCGGRCRARTMRGREVEVVDV